jgi:F1F0 ATPase subunit 2
MEFNVLKTIVGAAAGLLMGGLYFGGLWFTVNQVVGARNPQVLFGVSFLGRSALLLAAFYLLLLMGWEAAAGGMFGFLAARKAWTSARGRRRTG